jgi:hypothetical protein
LPSARHFLARGFEWPVGRGRLFEPDIHARMTQRIVLAAGAPPA